MRRSFEEKLRTFSQAQAQFEQEKKAALEELKAQHRHEIQELLRSHQSQNANYSKDQEKLGLLHKAEVTTRLNASYRKSGEPTTFKADSLQRMKITVILKKVEVGLKC